eukprot:6210414-Pleurochrysis_carterae.AAC.7
MLGRTLATREPNIRADRPCARARTCLCPCCAASKTDDKRCARCAPRIHQSRIAGFVKRGCRDSHPLSWSYESLSVNSVLVWPFWPFDV